MKRGKIYHTTAGIARAKGTNMIPTGLEDLGRLLLWWISSTLEKKGDTSPGRDLYSVCTSNFFLKEFEAAYASHFTSSSFRPMSKGSRIQTMVFSNDVFVTQ